MIDTCDEEQTLPPSANGAQRAEIMLRLLEEKVLSEREVKEGRSCALLLSLISSLEDREWRIVQDRMMEPVSKTHLAQVSTSIIRIVSQLLAQLQPKHQSRESEEPQRCSTPIGDHFHKHCEVSEETLAQSLGSSASQLSVKSMLGDVVKQLNQGLCVLAAHSLDSTETTGSEVTSSAMNLLALAGEALADVTDNAMTRDIDAFLETATKEVMSAIADSVSSCQERDTKSSRILQHLAAKMTQGCPPALVDLSSEKVSSDLLQSRGSCLQVLKGLLAKFLALLCPQSFSLMIGSCRSSMPSLESVSAEMLDIVVDTVKDLCQRKTSKFSKKNKVSYERVDTSAKEMKAALQKKLREFLACHRGALEEVKRDEMEEVKRTVATLLSNLRDKTAESEETQQEQIPRAQTDQICRDKGLIKLEDKLSQMLMTTVESPPSSGPIGLSEQVHHITKAAVKHLLMLFFLPPPSWGMGQVIRVQSSPLSATRFAESTQLYDDIISLYAQVMCEQVMSSFKRSSAAFRLQLEVESLLEQLQGDDSAPKKKKNISHFFQKFPKKMRNKWTKVINRSNVYHSPCEDGEDEEAREGVSELRRGWVVQFFQTLPDKIVTAFWGQTPVYWSAQFTFIM